MKRLVDKAGAQMRAWSGGLGVAAILAASIAVGAGAKDKNGDAPKVPDKPAAAAPAAAFFHWSRLRPMAIVCA